MDKNQWVFDEDRNTLTRGEYTLPLGQFEYDVLMTLWCVFPGSIDVGELLDECRHWGSLNDSLDGRSALSNLCFVINVDLANVGLKIYYDEDMDEIMLRALW